MEQPLGDLNSQMSESFPAISDAEDRQEGDWTSPMDEDIARAELERLCHEGKLRNELKYGIYRRSEMPLSRKYMRFTVPDCKKMHPPCDDAVHWKQSGGSHKLGGGLSYQQGSCNDKGLEHWRWKKWKLEIRPNLELWEVWQRDATNQKRHRPAQEATSTSSLPAAASPSSAEQPQQQQQRVIFNDPKYALHVCGQVLAEGYFTFSDATLKSNIRNCVFTLEELLQLKPVNYTMTGNTNRIHTGFLAQEVQQVCPQVVSNDPISGKLTVNYMELFTYFISSVQDFVRRTRNTEEKTWKCIRELQALYHTASDATASEAEVKKPMVTSSRRKSTAPLPAPPAVPTPYVCTVLSCAQAFATHRELSTHRTRKCHWQCPGCGALYESKERRDHHQIFYRHVLLTCRVCGQTFDRKENIHEHCLQARHFGCSRCKVKFGTDDLLRRHCEKEKHFDSDHSDPETHVEEPHLRKLRDAGSEGDDEEEEEEEGEDNSEEEEEGDVPYESGSDEELEGEELMQATLASAEDIPYSTALLLKFAEETRKDEPNNHDLARRYYLAAAKKGSVVAMRHLGLAYNYLWDSHQYRDDSEKTRRERERFGLAFLRGAADRGDAEAMEMASRLCFKYHDDEQGQEYLYLAAKAGYAQAQDALGNALLHGSYGFEFNYIEAEYWLRRAMRHLPSAKSTYASFCDEDYLAPENKDELKFMWRQKDLARAIPARVTDCVVNESALRELIAARVPPMAARKALALCADNLQAAYEWLTEQLSERRYMGELCAPEWTEEERGHLISHAKQLGQPTLVSILVSSRVHRGECTIGAGEQQQFLQECLRCSAGQTAKVNCCVSCAKRCHEGHELAEVRYVRTPSACLCGAGCRAFHLLSP